MTAANKIKLQNKAVKPFFAQNPDFDILGFDFFEKNVLDTLNWKGIKKSKTLDELKTYQRLLRIWHTGDDGDDPDEAVDVAERLKTAGFDSALKIAAMSEHRFVREHNKIFNGDKEKARQVHRRAMQIKARIQHLFANIHGTVASPHFRAMPANNIDSELTDDFENIPGYQDLFGSLDYLDCKHCCSIFSPAAYFLDMMRIIDEYITDPNTHKDKNNIPDGLKLQDRRPDLFELQLTCENTNTPVPYLQIVNSILERRIGGGNTFQTLATAPYPFNLPFHLPLVQIRKYLDNLAAALTDIYNAFNSPVTGGTAGGSTDTTITLANTASADDDAYNTMQVVLISGTGAGQARTVTHYDGSTKQAFVNEKWDTPPDNTSQYHIFGFIGADREYLRLSIEQYNNLITVHDTDTTAAPFYGCDSIDLDDLAHVETFLHRTGLKWDQLNELLAQGLSQQELADGTANDFYIDNTGETIPYMQIIIDQSDPDNPYYKTENLTIKRLDRLSRFIRLAAQLKWSYANLDWALKSIGAVEITQQAIKSISGIKRLQDAAGLEVDELCSSWYDMKTVGKGDGPHPRDLFDRVFNNPALLEGQDPYTSTDPIPFDPDRPLNWDINDTTGQNGITRARLLGALKVSDNDLTILGNYVLLLTGSEPGTPLDLTLTNLTWLYRLAKAAAAFKMTVDEYLCLLGLMYYPDSNYLKPPAGVLNPTVNKIIAQKERVEWFKRSPFTVYEVLYILEGTRTKYCSAPYKTGDIAPFIENLSTISEGSRVNKNSFIFGDIDAQRSEEIFAKLVEEKFLTDIGLVLNNEDSYNQAANQFPLDKDSFIVEGIITQAESQQVFEDLQNCHPPILLPQGDGSKATLSQSFNKDTNLDFLFAGVEDGDNKRNQVRSTLIRTKENIGSAEFSFLFPPEEENAQEQDAAHTAEIMNAAGILQGSNAMQGLADFLGTMPDMLSAIIPFATNKTNLSDFVISFLTPIKNGQVPENIPPFIALLARALVLFDHLSFSIDEVNAAVEMPGAFNIKNTTRVTFDSIRSLSVFKSLEKAFNEQDNSLIAYFNLPTDTGCPGAKVEALARLAHWAPDQVCTLIDTFWPEDEGKSDFDYTTVTGVNRLKRCFDMAGKTGMNIDSLLQLNSLGSLPLVDTNHQVIQDNWQTYTNLAGNVLGAVYAKFNHEEFEKVNKENTSYLETQKRNALLGYAIWVLNKQFPVIQKPSDLYQYLLIDVEMSGCDSISYIAQGIASIQLYMQRCRMMLEPGVTDLSHIPEVWWEWMSAYRIWEANRKIFLYPENYLDPGLRKNQTPQFKKFAESLLQTNIDDHTISGAYINYFNDFSVVANLVHCDSYNCKIRIPGVEKKVDTFFVFARTNTQPYTYYYRKFDSLYAWTPWQKIGLTINSLFISPVYAFSKLFIFWAEVDTINSSKVKNNQSIPLTSVKAKIKYSYLDSSDRWIEPQTIAGDIIVDYEEDYTLDDYVKNNLPGMENSFDPKNIYWQKVYVLHVPEESIQEDQLYPQGENIFVNYGFAVKAQKGASLPSPPEISTKIPPDQLSIETNVYNLGTRYNDIVEKSPQDETSYVLFIKNINLDSNLKNSQLNTVYVNNKPGFNPQPFYPLMKRSGNEMGINKSTSYNIIMDNFYNDDYKQIPAVTSSTLDMELLGSICGEVSNVVTIKNLPGSLIFDNGDEAFLVVAQDKNIQNISDILAERSNYQTYPEGEFCLMTSDYSSPPTPFDQLKFKFYRLTTSVTDTLNKKLITGGIKSLLTVESQETPELDFKRLKPEDAVIPPESDQLDFNGAYGCYFWEIFFHGPFLVADTLNMNQRFRDAKNWYQYIFNPTQQPEGNDDTGKDRFWRFLPFRSMTLQTLTEILTDSAQIAAYNNDPFDPDAIARLRISAYAKAIVMKYIDNLLDWGDYLFSQDTRESITQATNLYVMAADLLGKRPEAVGDYPVPDPMSFTQIKEKYGEDIPEFLIQVENSNFLPGGQDDLPFDHLPFNAIDSYFCVPENREFIGYWDRVEDRLYKIRHCMNIKGQVRTLAQFEPPINPRELIRAASSSGSLAQALNLNVNVPWYRFPLMIEKAKSLTSILTQLGSSLLAALEKKDAEALALLRSSQEKTLLDMTTSIKERQIEELTKMKASLEESLKSAAERFDYYTDLITKGLSPWEIANIVGMTTAVIFNVIAGITKAAASIGYALPQVGSPFAMTYGGQQIGSMLYAASHAIENYAVVSNFVAQLSLTMAGYERRGQEWQLQADLADFDREQIAYQVQANEIRQKISERELEIHQTTIRQNQEMEEFLKNKFTNRELYQWMVTRLSTVYFQTYSLAVQLALAAQRAYQFELDSHQSFVNFGYWDSLNKGLLAGEGLMLALNQMEKSYLDNNWRRLEIEKTISLLQWNPKALLDLKENGECTFELPEKIFDDDYPGHYARKIKTISISIPAVIGPYQNIKATLTQMSNQVIIKPDVNAVNFLLGGAGASMPEADTLRSNWLINQQIAVSRGVDDTGMFQLNFNDERYLPFEGTGAVSSWRLSMPKTTNRIDFSGISDVIIQLNYTAIDGGSKFREEVTGLDAMKPSYGSNFFSLARMFPRQWYSFLHDHDPANTGTQEMGFSLANLVPPYIGSPLLTGFYFKLDVPEGTNTVGTEDYIHLKVTDSLTIDFNLDQNGGYMHIFTTQPPVTDVEGNRSVTFTLAGTPADLKTGDQPACLDPAVIRDIVLILYYEGEIQWTQK
jgi:hypothetical protein